VTLLGALVGALLAAPASAPAVSPDAPAGLRCLVESYPGVLCGAGPNTLRWCDGAEMPYRTREAPPSDLEERLNTADLWDQMDQRYPVGRAFPSPPTADPGRLRHQPFFQKMYGQDAKAVAATTTTIRWLAGSVNVPLKVTTTNGVDRALAAVSAELDALPPALRRFVERPAGTFVWRTVKGTPRLSMHSFALAIDVGVQFSDYWKWVKPDADGKRPYRNRFPFEVVEVFERHGFIWGGKWAHFDTMHFEYRPELLHPACRAAAAE
jgi:hypothetical protein